MFALNILPVPGTPKILQHPKDDTARHQLFSLKIMANNWKTVRKAFQAVSQMWPTEVSILIHLI